MKYIELTVTTTSEAEEVVSDIFWEYTDYGVAISSVDEVLKLLKSNDVVYDYYEESVLDGAKGVSLVKGYFPIENANDLIAKVRKRFDDLKANGGLDFGTLETIKREVDGDDWIEIWKKHFKPIKIGDVTICPEWIKTENDGIVVKIDSNMAFGTGEHETTSMVVGEMQKFVHSNISVLDVGTGSGILGITAAKMGASHVVMTDIDSTACVVANKNCALNDVDSVCQVYCQGDLSKINEQFDLGLANITAEVLVVLSSAIADSIKCGGHLILSGILNDRVEKVIERFCSIGFEKVSQNSIGEWSSLVLKKLC